MHHRRSARRVRAARLHRGNTVALVVMFSSTDILAPLRRATDLVMISLFIWVCVGCALGVTWRHAAHFQRPPVHTPLAHLVPPHHACRRVISPLRCSVVAFSTQGSVPFRTCRQVDRRSEVLSFCVKEIMMGLLLDDRITTKDMSMKRPHSFGRSNMFAESRSPRQECLVDMIVGYHTLRQRFE